MKSAERTNPLVSIAVPVYNAELYIAQTISSALSQSYTNFELLLQDDCSTDRTAEVIASFDDPRIRYERNQTNRGPGYTRNILMSRAKGKYLAILDSDDICEPHRIQVQVEYMERHTKVVVCGSYMSEIDSNGDLNPKSVYRLLLTNDRIKARLLFASPMANPSVILRMEDIRNNSIEYDLNNIYADDMTFWNNAIDKVRFANIPQKLVRYRRWEGQIGTCKLELQHNDAVEVMFKRLARIGIELSEHERSIYKDIVFDQGDLSVEDAKAFILILRRIWAQNNIYKDYRPMALRRELTKRYKKASKRVYRNKLIIAVRQIVFWFSLCK